MPGRGLHSPSPDAPHRRAPRAAPSPRTWFDRFRPEGRQRSKRTRPPQAVHHHRDLLPRADSRSSRHRHHRVSCPAAVRRPAGHNPVTSHSLGTLVDLSSRPGSFEPLVIETTPLSPVVPEDRGVAGRRMPEDGPPADDPTPGHGRRRRRPFLAALLVAAVIGGTAVAAGVSGAVRHQLLLSFTRQPDNFAELYFPSPGSLPTTFVADRPLAVRFGLSNDSDTTRTFTFVVTAGLGAGRGVDEGGGTVPVRAGRTAVIPLRVSLPPGTTSLSISLAGQPIVIRLLLHQGAAHGS